jgi:glycosyltransferase involved in cell wall biosynthesis
MADLCGGCERAGVPSVLWITGAELTPGLLADAPLFDRVFSVDPLHIQPLEEAGCREPAPLPLATALPFDGEAPRDASQRPIPIAWIGGWRDRWSPGWQRVVTAVLGVAAERGLQVVGLPDSEVLPAELRRCCRALPPTRERILGEARLVLGIDREHESRHVVPGVVFDSIAAGAAVVSPHGYGVRTEFRDAVPVVSGEPDRDVLERLLDDDELWEQTVRRCRRFVAHNHTYSHRLATIMSGIGCRVVPDATEFPAHS